MKEPDDSVALKSNEVVNSNSQSSGPHIWAIVLARIVQVFIEKVDLEATTRDPSISMNDHLVGRDESDDYHENDGYRANDGYRNSCQKT